MACERGQADWQPAPQSRPQRAMTTMECLTLVSGPSCYAAGLGWAGRGEGAVVWMVGGGLRLLWVGVFVAHILSAWC